MSRLNKLIFFLLCATPICTTLAYGTVHQPLIIVFYFMMTLLMVLWAIDGNIGGALRFSRSALQIPLILLGVYALIQVIPFGYEAQAGGVSSVPRTISVEPFSTKITALHMFALAAFFALSLVYIESAERLRRVVTLITVFGFIYSFYAILQSVLSPTKIYGLYGPASAIPFGSFVNRHNFAAFIEMAIAVPLGLVFAGAVRPDKRLLYWIAIGLMASALLLSGSRGGFVAFVVEIIVLLIVTTRAHGRKNFLLKAALSVLLMATAVGGAIFVGGDTSLTRFAETATSADVTSSRTHIWGVTLKVISAHLPFGAGLGAFPQAYTRFDTTGGMERVEQAHNDYLQVAADAGVVGVVLGGLFLFWFFREGKRNVERKNTFRRGVAVGAFAGCCAILTHSIFDFVLHITAISVTFLMLLALLVASGRRYADDITEFDEPRSKRRRRKASVTKIDDAARRQPAV